MQRSITILARCFIAGCAAPQNETQPPLNLSQWSAQERDRLARNVIARELAQRIRGTSSSSALNAVSDCVMAGASRAERDQIASLSDLPSAATQAIEPVLRLPTVRRCIEQTSPPPRAAAVTQTPRSTARSAQPRATPRAQVARRYIRGPRGGCYYLTSRGSKVYVDRSMCRR